MPEQTSDVLVVGGGVIGLSVAYFCARAGLGVRLVERGELGREASWAGAGIIPPGRAATARSNYARLLGTSSEMYPELSAALREETGIDNGYWRCGGFELGFDDRDAHALRSAAGHHNREGITWQLLDRAAAQEIEPALCGAFQTCYHIPEMAQVRNPRHLKSLVAACQRRGVEIIAGAEVSGFEISGDRVQGVRTPRCNMAADVVVVTAGAWSSGLLDQLGIALPVRPVRGQIALIATEPPLLHRIVMIGKQYIVPREDGRVLVGSTEEDVGFDCRPTPAGIRELLDLAVAVVPSLANAHLERTWAGLRPASPDSKPFIGPVPGYRNLLVAAGHFRAGLQLSPITGLVVSQLVTGQTPAVPLDSFRLDRPFGSAVEE